MNTGKVILLFFITLLFIACSEPFRNGWKVKISFNPPAINPETVQIAWFDFNPAEMFIQKFKMAGLNNRLKDLKSENEKNQEISFAIAATWNHLFDAVKKNRIYALGKDGMMYSESNDPVMHKKKKWLVSKVFYLNDKPFGYAVPLDVVNSTRFEITLNKDNLILLTDLYNKINK